MTPNYITDLQKVFQADDLIMQQRRRFSVTEICGNIEMAARREEQAGTYKAYEIIKDEFPDAAKMVLRVSNMNEDGSMRL